jgi:hypothetical protein
MRPLPYKEYTMDEILIKEPFPTRFTNFVSRHKVAIAVTATASACLAIHRVSLRQHDEFLKEKGLLEEFYTPEEYYENQ